MTMDLMRHHRRGIGRTPADGLWVLLFLVIAGPLHAAATQPAPASPNKKPKPTTVIAPTDCTTAGCHANVIDHEVVHGPVNVNACDACHTLTDAAQHKYDFARDKTKLCTFCHQIDTSKAKVIHKPMTTGECLQCHEPHGGFNKQFVRGKNMRDMCGACHQDVAANKKHIHGPVAAGVCGSCHAPHMSDKPKLLVAEGRQLCVDCHKEMETQLAAAKFKHKAVEEDCQSCHDPHASDFTMQIRQAPVELCTKCHEKVKKAATEAPVKHSVVLKDQACLYCHTAHGSNLAQLMRREPTKICMGCHDKPIKVDKDKTVASMKDVTNPKLFKHGPIKDGQCSGCHTTHGSQAPSLLVKAYPPAFYQSFSIDNYALCFSCHNKDVVLSERTDKMTKFRNGEQNLHFVHVNKQDRGRSCRACHSTHASQFAMHIRESVPYGNWQMPINFKPTQTGGTCTPGCHKKLDYDRVTPSPNTIKNPSTQPAS